MSDLCALTATELLKGYRNKAFSPVEVAAAVLKRIEKLNPKLNAFRLVSDRLKEEAKASEQRWLKTLPLGPLDGVPVSVKDIILTKGWSTLRGSKTVDPKGPWNDDAPAVARLRETGALLTGKTTTPEFGWKGVTDSPLTGITRNPWNPAKTPGGSSGGAAAQLASGMGPLALGTDGGGSIRIPCSFSGLFGIKASFGRVPAWPPSPFGTVAHVGPMARSVADAALMLNVIAQPDARDWYALPYEKKDFLAGLEDGVRGLRIAFSPDLGYARVDSEVLSLVKKAIPVFEQLGAKIEEVGKIFDNAEPIFRPHWFAGAAFLMKTLNPKKLFLVDPGLREVAAQGRKIATSELIDAQMKRYALGQRMNRFHEDYDLLLTPTLAVPAFDVGRESPPKNKRWTDWTPFTFPFNLTQQPAASIPCGLTKAGLPVGLQIVGPRFREDLVLRAARAYETLRPVVLPDLAKLGGG